MSKASAYRQAVDSLHEYDQNMTLTAFLCACIERLRRKGYSPQFCADFLGRLLRDEVDRLATFGE